MPSYDKLKKQVKNMRTDFKENNYYAIPEIVSYDEVLTKSSLRLTRVLGKLIAKGRLKLPPEPAFTISDIAKTNETTKDKLIDRLFDELATEEVKREYYENGGSFK